MAEWIGGAEGYRTDHDDISSFVHNGPILTGCSQDTSRNLEGSRARLWLGYIYWRLERGKFGADALQVIYANISRVTSTLMVEL